MRSVLPKNNMRSVTKQKLENVPAIKIFIKKAMIKLNISMFLHMSSTDSSPTNHANNLQTDEPSKQFQPGICKLCVDQTNVLDMNSIEQKDMHHTTNIRCADKQCWTWDNICSSCRPRKNQTTLQQLETHIMFSCVVKLTRTQWAPRAPLWNRS